MAEEQKQQKRQRLTPEQRIARHEQAIARLKAQQNRRSRQLETREKIVVGSTVIAAMRRDAGLRGWVSSLLSSHVTRELDREAVAEWLSPTSTPAQ